MPVGPLLSFISFWTPWTTTQTLSPLIPTLPSSKMNAQPRIQKRREKFSKATNKSKGNTNQPVKKDSPKFNQKLTLTSSPSFRRRALYGNLMGWKNVQSIMVPAHPRNLLTKAVLSFKSLWQETQITWTSRWLLSPRMQHDKNNEYRISYSISRNQNIIVSIDSFTGRLLAQYLFLGLFIIFKDFVPFRVYFLFISVKSKIYAFIAFTVNFLVMSKMLMNFSDYSKEKYMKMSGINQSP